MTALEKALFLAQHGGDIKAIFFKRIDGLSILHDEGKCQGCLESLIVSMELLDMKLLIVK